MIDAYQIRADFDERTVVVYQAYPDTIAEAALFHGRFVPPFSFDRMTWIKPSFLWMMERSGWGRKPGQERVLAVRITRAGWERALGLAVLTHPEPGVYRDHADWQAQADQAVVRVQWDPERSLRGASLPHRSIQVGLSRRIIREYVEEWAVELRDCTPLVRKLRALIQGGRAADAQRLLPGERPYPVSAVIARRLGMLSP